MFLAPPSSTQVESSVAPTNQSKPRDSWGLDSMLQSSFFSGIPTGSASASPNLFANFPSNKSATSGKGHLVEWEVLHSLERGLSETIQYLDSVLLAFVLDQL